MLEKFLKFLFDGRPNLWIEVRRIAPPSQRFYATQDILLVAADAEHEDNVFVGVVPRVRKGGKASDTSSHTDVLWADIDKKNGLRFEQLINTGLPTPNVVLDSGHGWHLYWKLEKQITVNQAQQLMGDIAFVVGGDAVGDPARIMRLPDTMNVKPNQPPIKTRVLRLNDKDRHHPADFYNGGQRVVRTHNAPRKKMNGVKTRSEELFAIAMDGLMHGQSRIEIVRRMKESPACSKLDEMPPLRRDQWITHALQNAREILSKRQGR